MAGGATAQRSPGGHWYNEAQNAMRMRKNGALLYLKSRYLDKNKDV